MKETRLWLRRASAQPCESSPLGIRLDLQKGALAALVVPPFRVEMVPQACGENLFCVHDVSVQLLTAQFEERRHDATELLTNVSPRQQQCSQLQFGRFSLALVLAIAASLAVWQHSLARNSAF